ncbi:MAG: flagellar type III secretion system protein FliR, partial [Rubrobacteridae bacterium]|nr:flagellar type III secretion system protein FliR [Rubrobacteridae bacterium]
MDLLNTSKNDLILFLLILTRISGVFFSAPVLGSRNIPPQLKIGFSLIFAMLLLPFVKHPDLSGGINLISLMLMVASELAVGIIIGFTATLIFTGFLLAGQIIDFQMGFGMVNVVDPLSNVSVSIIGQFKNLLAVLVFLAINGHHFFFTALSKSFEILPLTTFSLTTGVSTSFMRTIGEVFIVGFRIGAPAIGILVISELALGIIARNVPQMNVFVVGLPMKIIVGFISVIM